MVQELGSVNPSAVTYGSFVLLAMGAGAVCLIPFFSSGPTPSSIQGGHIFFGVVLIQTA